MRSLRKLAEDCLADILILAAILMIIAQNARCQEKKPIEWSCREIQVNEPDKSTIRYWAIGKITFSDGTFQETKLAAFTPDTNGKKDRHKAFKKAVDACADWVWDNTEKEQENGGK